MIYGIRLIADQRGEGEREENAYNFKLMDIIYVTMSFCLDISATAWQIGGSSPF